MANKDKSRNPICVIPAESSVTLTQPATIVDIEKEEETDSNVIPVKNIFKITQTTHTV